MTRESARRLWTSEEYRSKVIAGLHEHYLKTAPKYIRHNPLIECACSCGEYRKKYDNKGRERRFVKGHARRCDSEETRMKHSASIKKCWVINRDKMLNGTRKSAEKLRGCKLGPHTKEHNLKISMTEKGKTISLETRLKQRESRLRYIKKHPEEAYKNSAKVGDILRGRKQSPNIVQAVRDRWKNPEYREMRLKQILKFKSPNKPEKRMIDIVKRNNLPYKFVGDGALIINGYNPDFANCNGDKLLLEVFGDYWHNRPDWKERDEKRLKAFESLGYRTLVFWEHEIIERRKVPPSLTEEEIISRISNVDMWPAFVGKRHRGKPEEEV